MCIRDSNKSLISLIPYFRLWFTYLSVSSLLAGDISSHFYLLCLPQAWSREFELSKAPVIWGVTHYLRRIWSLKDLHAMSRVLPSFSERPFLGEALWCPACLLRIAKCFLKIMHADYIQPTSMSGMLRHRRREENSASVRNFFVTSCCLFTLSQQSTSEMRSNEWEADSY